MRQSWSPGSKNCPAQSNRSKGPLALCTAAARLKSVSNFPRTLPASSTFFGGMPHAVAGVMAAGRCGGVVAFGRLSRLSTTFVSSDEQRKRVLPNWSMPGRSARGGAGLGPGLTAAWASTGMVERW